MTGELAQGFARGVSLCVRLVRFYFGVLTLGVTGEKCCEILPVNAESLGKEILDREINLEVRGLYAVVEALKTSGCQ